MSRRRAGASLAAPSAVSPPLLPTAHPCPSPKKGDAFGQQADPWEIDQQEQQQRGESHGKGAAASGSVGNRPATTWESHGKGAAAPQRRRAKRSQMDSEGKAHWWLTLSYTMTCRILLHILHSLISNQWIPSSQAKLPDEAISSEAVESHPVQDWFNTTAGVGDPDELFLALKFQEINNVQWDIFWKLLPYFIHSVLTIFSLKCIFYLLLLVSRGRSMLPISLRKSATRSKSKEVQSSQNEKQEIKGSPNLQSGLNSDIIISL